MKQPITFKVDEDLYTIQPFLTSYGMRLLTEITTLVGGPALQLAFQLKDGDKKKKDKPVESVMEKEIDPEMAGKVIMNLTDKIEASTVDDLFKKILQGTLIGNTSITATARYDIHFQGRYQHLFKVVWHSLEAQYGDFLGALGGLAGPAIRAKLR